MDWAKAIERNRGALLAIAAGLAAMLAFAGGGISREVRCAVLRILRPAESAVRRLIVIAARGVVAKPLPIRPMPALGIAAGGGAKRLAFRLFDAPRSAACFGPESTRLNPRIRMFTPDAPLAFLFSSPAPTAAPPPETQVNAHHLHLRLAALERALGSLPRQAQRFLRAQGRRQAALTFTRAWPLRSGPPPGHCPKPVHAVDRVLAELHGLAFDALKPDTC